MNRREEKYLKLSKSVYSMGDLYILWKNGGLCNMLRGVDAPGQCWQIPALHVVLKDLSYWNLVVVIRGHPFMTSTRRGRGSGSGGRGRSSPMWTSTQKIKIRVH